VGNYPGFWKGCNLRSGPLLKKLKTAGNFHFVNITMLLLETEGPTEHVNSSPDRLVAFVELVALVDLKWGSRILFWF
jgi:hypothetical protein